jgi:hypothetical protein
MNAIRRDARREQQVDRMAQAYARRRNKGRPNELPVTFDRKDQGMDNELCTAMLTAVFAAVIALLGLVFVDQRKREEAALLLRSIAISEARAVPSYSQHEGFPRSRTRARTPSAARTGSRQP